MKNRFGLVVTTGILSLVYSLTYSTHAQELTAEQISAENAQKQAPVSKVQITKGTANRQASLPADSQVGPPPPPPPIFDPSDSGPDDSGGETNPPPPTPQLQTGTSFIQQVIANLGITADQMYNIGAFNTASWQTDPESAGVTYPWSYMTPRTLTPTNGYKAVSFEYPLGLPAGQGRLWCGVPYRSIIYTNSGFSITNPVWYIVRFWYTFNKNGGESYFRCQTNATPGIVLDLTSAPTTNWTQVTMILSNLPIYFYWNVVKDALAGGTYGPNAQIDGVQFIPIPGPSTNDLSVNVNGDNVIVQWNALTYIIGRFHLEYAANPSGPWAVNTATVSVTDWVASVTYTNSGDIRFYRMAHN